MRSVLLSSGERRRGCYGEFALGVGFEGEPRQGFEDGVSVSRIVDDLLYGDAFEKVFSCIGDFVLALLL